MLRPNEGVICTRYEGVYLIQGRAYEFAFWWNDIHHIHDVASFADFCQRHGIRYWVVEPCRKPVARDQRCVGNLGDVLDGLATGVCQRSDGRLRRDRDLPTSLAKDLHATQWPTAMEKTGKPCSPLAASASLGQPGGEHCGKHGGGGSRLEGPGENRTSPAAGIRRAGSARSNSISGRTQP